MYSPRRETGRETLTREEVIHGRRNFNDSKIRPQVASPPSARSRRAACEEREGRRWELTRDEILRLEGRELDDALSPLFVYTVKHFTWEYDGLQKPSTVWKTATGESVNPIPLSTTWQGVGLVVEAMRAKGWRMRLETFEDSVDAEFYFPALINSEGWLERDSKHFRATADDAPRAVALAALLAMEGA